MLETSSSRFLKRRFQYILRAITHKLEMWVLKFNSFLIFRIRDKLKKCKTIRKKYIVHKSEALRKNYKNSQTRYFMLPKLLDILLMMTQLCCKLKRPFLSGVNTCEHSHLISPCVHVSICILGAALNLFAF
jgi:hypothetical protein